MRLFANLSIRAKLTAVISLLFWTVSIFIFIFFPARQRDQANEALLSRARTLAANATIPFSEQQDLESDKVREHALHVARFDSLLLYVMLIDSKGNLVEAINPDIARQVHYKELADPFGSDAGICKASAEIRSREGKRLGTMYIGLSTRDVLAGMEETQTTIALISLIIFLIGVVTVIGVSTVITNPLRNMVETVEQIASGDYVQRANVSSQDEVGHLAFSFNQMVGNLKKAYDELEHANLNLEQRVTERTRELNEEVQERRRVEEALRDSESRQRAVISALPTTLRAPSSAPRPPGRSRASGGQSRPTPARGRPGARRAAAAT
ncbi:MAG: HAMP domain-containing protein [Bacteroidota bacterium]|nr:HAMP domain-containing protein [Bacteroidota bacterium]